MENKRIEWIDVLKGIGIILVVLGHSFWGGRNVIYLFHMPLFFLVSGYWVKENQPLDMHFFLKKCKTLLIPYCFFSVVSLLTTYVEMNADMNIGKWLKQLLLSKRGQIETNQVLWFITALFCVEITYAIICRFVKQNLIKGVVCMVMALLCHQFISTPLLPFSADAAMYYMFFYYCGNMLNKCKMDNTIFNKISLICLLVLCLATVRPSTIQHIIEYISSLHAIAYAAISIIFSFIGILGIVGLAIRLQSSLLLQKLGQYSLTIMGLHLACMNGVYYLLSTALGLQINPMSNIYCVFVTAVTIIILCPICQFIHKNCSKVLGR